MKVASFLPVDFVDGIAWMGMRQIAFGARAEAVSLPIRQDLLSLGLIKMIGERVHLTSMGKAKLALGEH